MSGAATYRLIVSGGGTGGHLYPGIAVARAFMARDPATTVTFVGTAAGIESRVVPREGFGLDQIRSAGLKLAVDPRQIRNAHYLLGEAFYKAGNIPAAEYHFGELGRFYPQFQNLTNLLFAIDLRRVVNFKL